MGAEFGPLTSRAISADKKHKARICLSKAIIFQNCTADAENGSSLSHNTFALLPAYLSQTLSKQWGSRMRIFKKRTDRKVLGCWGGFVCWDFCFVVVYGLFVCLFSFLSLDSYEEQGDAFGQVWR